MTPLLEKFSKTYTNTIFLKVREAMERCCCLLWTNVTLCCRRLDYAFSANKHVVALRSLNSVTSVFFFNLSQVDIETCPDFEEFSKVATTYVAEKDATDVLFFYYYYYSRKCKPYCVNDTYY
jgi:hypothetical protein